MQPAALAPVPMLGQVAMPDLLTTVIAPVEPAPVIPAAPSAEDAWADFTGSLASSSTTSVSEPEPEANVVSVEAAEERVERRRSSLSRSVLTAALLPLLLATVATVVTVFVTEPRLQRTLLSQNAQAVAVAVASNLDTSDQNTVYAQIDTLLKRSTVGFVQVELPDGTTFFRSKTPDTDGPLSVKVANWVQGHPGSSSFVQKGSAADAYRYQLGLLEQVGATSSEQANSLRKAIAEPANQRSSTTTYVLSRIGVSSSQQGDRVIGEPQDLQASNLLYNIAVGVPSNDAQTALRRNLLVIFSLSLLFFVVAALMAARTARRIVEPIERLVKAADAISMGDLERPVRPERNDEIGDLAEALERMRLSLEAAMERLRRRRAR
ncbi:HAMP domain-containing protein [Deinococcus sonorensis]|uniref:histidine kinase n=1 Tax=Deinococcus sonorensis KR-87 TaxID=694439 RepID=A0AAU7U9A9_9DEIO